MTEKFNAALIEAIHTYAPVHSNPAGVVADTLLISREAAYRRLRGDVPFTFGEAAALGAQLHFSLDRILGSGEGNVLFNLKFTEFCEPLDRYGELLEHDIGFFREAASDPATVVTLAGNTLPEGLYFRYENLTRFKFFKWIYQHGLGGPSMHTFADMHLPEWFGRLTAEYVAGVQSAATTHYLFDDTSFRHWLNAVRAFREMHLISDEDVRSLREELFCLLDDMERIACVGAYSNGNNISFYLSDVDLEASYSYVSTSSYRSVGIGIFSLNTLRTTDALMYDYVRNWVLTQSRFATIISRSGELRRIRYFKQQREIVGGMG